MHIVVENFWHRAQRGSRKLKKMNHREGEKGQENNQWTHTARVGPPVLTRALGGSLRRKLSTRRPRKCVVEVVDLAGHRHLVCSRRAVSHAHRGWVQITSNSASTTSHPNPVTIQGPVHRPQQHSARTTPGELAHGPVIRSSTSMFGEHLKVFMVPRAELKVRRTVGPSASRGNGCRLGTSTAHPTQRHPTDHSGTFSTDRALQCALHG